MTTETDPMVFEVAGVVFYDSDLARAGWRITNQLSTAAGLLPSRAPAAVLSTTKRTEWRRVRRIQRQLKRGSRPSQTSALNLRDRSAVRRYVHKHAHQVLSDLAAHIRGRAGEADPAPPITELDELMALWRLAPPQANPLDRSSGGDNAEEARRPRRRTRASRRCALKGLPADWQIQILRQADQRDRPWMAVLIITGLRPGALLDHGVTVELDEDALRLKVPGGKSAIGFRYMTVHNTDTVSAALFSWVQALGARTCISPRDTEPDLTYDRMAARHHAASRRALGQGVPMTAHRQQLHADLKARGWSRVEIARATDKTSSRSVSVYATAHQGRARAAKGLLSVRSDWSVRDVARPAAGANAATTSPTGPDRSTPEASAAGPDVRTPRSR